MDIWAGWRTPKPPVRDVAVGMAGDDAPDFEQLEQYFSALAYSMRLELLHVLRFPTNLQDIRLKPRQVRAGQSADRPASRQAVQEHLDRLMEIGVVVVEEGANGRKEYRVNPPKLYRIMEEFRQVGVIMADSMAAPEATAGVDPARTPPQAPGPKLVLVHGLLEGKAFPLRASDAASNGSLLIGRKAGLPVSLEYDPFVSLENSEIVREGDDHLLADLPTSRNGTWLNWRRLAPGVRAKLEPGDTIRVGRSLLVYRRT